MSDQTRVGHCKRDSTDAYVGRGPDGVAFGDVPWDERGGLGNPYTLEDYDRAESIRMFRREFENALDRTPALREYVGSLQGETLGCWCRSVDEDGPGCHGDVIAEYADYFGDGGDGDE